VEILEPFEGRRVRPGCLLRPEEACRDDGPCSAHPAWGEVKAAWLRFLEETTLADIRGGAVPLEEAPRPARTRGRAPRSTRTSTRRRKTR
jgi:DNA-binding IscR family transcriptional regulator